MAKKEKPLFASMLAGGGSAAAAEEPVVETEAEMSDQVDVNPAGVMPEAQVPVDVKPEEEKSSVIPVAPHKRGLRKETKPHSGSGPQIYIKGEPVKPILINLSMELYNKLCIIASAESLSKRDIVHQAMSHCFAIYEKRNGSLRRKAVSERPNIFD